MSREQSQEKRERRDWLIILLILLLGFLCVCVAGQWAIRFAPNWSVGRGMDSNIDPNSQLTDQPDGEIAAIDPNILTKPAWFDNFLTPGASGSQPGSTLLAPVGTQISSPTAVSTLTPVPSVTSISTVTSIPTVTAVTVVPVTTPIIIYASPTKKIPPPPPPPVVTTDLQITNTDGSTVYVAGSTISYTVVVTNNGSNGVTGATVVDSKPAQVTSWGWCVSPCTPTANTSSDLSATINIASGTSVTYLVTANIDAAATGDLVNTVSVSVPAGYADSNTSNNSFTDTDTITTALTTDLKVEITDNSTNYIAGQYKLLPNTFPYSYTITVTNLGPSKVIGATVSNAFTDGTSGTYVNVEQSSIGWTCAPLVTCTSLVTPSFGVGNNINALVTLNSGASVTFYLAVQVAASPSGDLVNTATVTTGASGVTDSNGGNDSATDTDLLVTASTFPYGQIDTIPNCPGVNCTENIAAGSFVTLQFGTPLVVNGHTSWDLVYYELPVGSGINMDAVILKVGDGSNWYTVLNWGDGSSNNGTNIVNPPGCAGEPDNCPIDSSLLYNSTGIAIDLDGLVPNGTYPYIRIYSPATCTLPACSSPNSTYPDTDGHLEVDAIQTLP